MDNENAGVSLGTISRYVEINTSSSLGTCDDAKISWVRETASIDHDSAVIALIEPRLLVGQCLLLALRSIDHASSFSVYRSVTDWRLSADWASTSLVLICASDSSGEGGAAVDLDHDLPQLQMCRPAVKFAVLSDQETPKDVLKAMQSGAQGYIPTSLSLEVTCQILQLMIFGGTYVPTASMMTMAGTPNTGMVRQEENNLIFTSQRQLMVARALRKGSPNKVIAYQLNMCESTVKVHVRNIMKKLKAKNRTEVALLTTQMFPDDGGN